MSPLCTPFATFPVTVEDGDGLDVVTTGDGDGEEKDEGEGVGEGVGAEAVRSATGFGGAAALFVLCDEWPRPTATTAPAVPPAITTHPTAKAAMAARLRRVLGIPTPDNGKTPLKSTR